MNEIDLTIPKDTYRVPVVVTRHGVNYMGPDVKVNAHSAEDAVRRVKEAGYRPNSWFGPTKTSKD